MVLMKLRLNVPLQDLAFRFGMSLSTVSRTFSAWMIVMDIRLSPLVRWPERGVMAYNAYMLSVCIWEKDHHHH